MTAAELRGTYMADTYEAFEWFCDKFIISTRAARKTQATERYSIKEYKFYHIPQHGEKAKEMDDNRGVLAPLKRSREMPNSANQKRKHQIMVRPKCVQHRRTTAAQLRGRPF